MAVTRSTRQERRQDQRASATFDRTSELFALMIASALVVAALYLVYQAKAVPPTGAPLDLSNVDRREQLLGALDEFKVPAERQLAAQRVFDWLKDHPRLPNVGALSSLRISATEIDRNRRLENFRERLAEARTRSPEVQSIPLFTAAGLARFKRQVIVRTGEDFLRSFLLWSALFIGIFYAVHIAWRLRGFSGSTVILPAIHLLSGIGLVSMVSLRDPFRDTLLFAGFAQGVVLGAVLLYAASQIDWQRQSGGLSYVPLLASFLLSMALIAFGSGPAGSDAKVNLGGFQPVEAIKILLVYFLAGYFASRWEFLRELKERRPELARVTRWIEIPRLEFTLPVLAGVGVALLFFYSQKDLGPALVIAGLFLTLYTIARRRVLLASIGMAILISGFAAGYFFGVPRTVRERVDMWISPWDNHVRGGEQVVHALWALASGGATGSGLGLGEPQLMPAGHTDLIVAAIGEEWGFAGVLGAYALLALLVWIGLRIALRAPTDYTFFLALGLTLLIAFETLLISGGILDLLPLSGVVTPFLSYGRTAMLANFAIFGMLLSICRTPSGGNQTEPFRDAVRVLSWALAAGFAVVIAKAAWVQVFHADAVMGAGTLTIQADGHRRYQYNPRLLEIARSIPRGSIHDRNGLPIATSNWEELQSHASAYAQLGIDLAKCCDRSDSRYYPLGPLAAVLLGDLSTRGNWSA